MLFISSFLVKQNLHKKDKHKKQKFKNIKTLVFNVSKYDDLLGKHQHGFITLKTLNFDVI